MGAGIDYPWMGQMAGAERSLVTVGRSLTVANGFPPLWRMQEMSDKRMTERDERRGAHMTYARKAGGALEVPLDWTPCGETNRIFLVHDKTQHEKGSHVFFNT